MIYLFQMFQHFALIACMLNVPPCNIDVFLGKEYSYPILQANMISKDKMRGGCDCIEGIKVDHLQEK